MKKIALIIVVLISLTACQNNPDLNKNLNISSNKEDKTASVSQLNINANGDNSTAPDIKNSTFNMGGLQVQGMMDVNALEKAQQQSKQNTLAANKKGLIVDQNGFNPKSIQATVGIDLLIYNNSNETISISSSNAANTVCKDFGEKLTIASKQTQTIKLLSSESCTLSNSQKPEQKALILVK